jgi:tetratricopeptide (TPR) repeat protein
MQEGTAGSMRQTLVLALLLVLAAILPELPALHGEFQWDDEVHVSQNANLHDVRGLARTWTDPTSNIQYYPLSMTAFWVEYQCFGVENLAGYHLVNMLLHAVNVVLVWIMLRRLRIPWAWLAALVFAVHPLVVESVAYISELKNLLSGLFTLLATLAWLRWSDSPARPRWGMLAACLLAFLAALLAKSTACTFPVVMLLIEWWRNGRISRRQWIASVPLLLVGIALGLLFSHVEHEHVGAAGAAFEFGVGERLLIASRAVCFYAMKIVWPSHLLVVYPRWDKNTGAWVNYWFMAVVLGVLALAWVLREKWGRGFLVAALLFIVLLAPALGFISYFPMLFTFVANHYVYLAMVPFIVGILAVIRLIAARLHMPARWAEPALAVLSLVVLTPLTCVQAARWQTKVLLWEPAAAVQPDSWYVTANLANGYVEHGQFAEARQWAERSLAANPANSRAWFSLGRAWLGLANPAEAITAYQHGLSEEPGNAVALYDLAFALQQVGDLPRAEQAWRDLATHNPGNAQAWNNLAGLLIRRSAFQEGADAAARAIADSPSYGMAHVNRGLALEKLGQFREAATELKTGLALVPENGRVRLELARSLAAGDDPFAALAEYRRVINELPNASDAQAEYEALMRQTRASAPTQPSIQNP